MEHKCGAFWALLLTQCWQCEVFYCRSSPRCMSIRIPSGLLGLLSQFLSWFLSAAWCVNLEQVVGVHSTGACWHCTVYATAHVGRLHVYELYVRHHPLCVVSSECSCLGGLGIPLLPPRRQSTRRVQCWSLARVLFSGADKS